MCATVGATVGIKVGNGEGVTVGFSVGVAVGEGVGRNGKAKVSFRTSLLGSWRTDERAQYFRHSPKYLCVDTSNTH